MLSFVNLLLFLIVIISVNGARDKKSGEFCTQPNGNSGVCISFRKCQAIVQQIRENLLTINELKKYRCGFEGLGELSCCSSEEFYITYRKSKRVCDKYINKKTVPTDFQVLNGNEASVVDFPHTCLIRYDEKSTRCGGSLISDRWVLTAAHCQVDLAIDVLLGTDDLSSTAPDKIFEIEEKIAHENHNNATKHNDIALIKLIESVRFSDTIHPACLFNDVNGPAEGVDLIVTGFGKDHLLKTASNFLLQGSLQVSPTSRCSDRYKKIQNLEIISSQICANGNMTNQDACRGDSGGPLQILLSENKRISSVVGIVSYASSCSTHDGVYTRVASYLDWIEGHVWPEDV